MTCNILPFLVLAAGRFQDCLQNLISWGGEIWGRAYGLMCDIKDRLEILGANPHFLIIFCGVLRQRPGPAGDSAVGSYVALQTPYKLTVILFVLRSILTIWDFHSQHFVSGEFLVALYLFWLLVVTSLFMVGWYPGQRNNCGFTNLMEVAASMSWISLYC